MEEPTIVSKVVYAVNGDGYINEVRHEEDAKAIYYKSPYTRRLRKRTVITITTDWSDVVDG